jgi:pimeloyl-ACP methyl ester carboxylesterase
MAIAFGILGFIITVYLVVAITMVVMQERFLFNPDKLPPDFQFSFTEPFTEKWLEVDGLKLDTLHFKKPGAKGLIFYLHGNADSLKDWGVIAANLVKHTGWDVWVLDYPGYGKSEGFISGERQLNKIAEAFWAEAKHEYPNAPIVIFGRSIGTGIASRLASKVDPSGLFLETPYFNLSSLVLARAPFAPVFLMKYRFRSNRRLPKVKCPIFMVHGTKDRTIPYSQAKSLAAIQPRAEFLTIEGGDHSDLPSFPEYWQALERWFAARAPNAGTGAGNSDAAEN